MTVAAATPADNQHMNSVGEASLHAVLRDPGDPGAIGQALSARVAVAAAAKVLQVQREMGNQIVALLDPNVGANIDRKV
ncbi:MAG: hypothetical protein C0506_08080 [Anaerolinea sp.]|nr:hypothetical protein [Anaerolinea sp.]